MSRPRWNPDWKSWNDASDEYKAYCNLRRKVVATHCWEYIGYSSAKNPINFNSRMVPPRDIFKYKCKNCGILGEYGKVWDKNEPPDIPSICKLPLTCQEGQIRDIIL